MFSFDRKKESSPTYSHSFIYLVLLTFGDRFGVVSDIETVSCFWDIRSEADEQRVSGGSNITRRVTSAVRVKKRCWRTGAIVDLNTVVGTIEPGLEIETREV